jgi:hypothetical protein
MIFGHLSPPVTDAGSHGHRWREIVTKITDVSNNKVNNNMPATYVLIFSLTIHLIDICGNVSNAPMTLQRERLFICFLSSKQQSTHIAVKLMKRALRDAVICRRRWSTSGEKWPLIEPSVA